MTLTASGQSCPLAAHGQRTDARVLSALEAEFDCEVVPMQTSGAKWYDLDLAVAVIDDSTLAYCPAALDPSSQRRVGYLGVDLIKVSEAEASRFALNLISDGRVVTMATGAPRFSAELRERGLNVVELATSELTKGGGGVRCTALTLDDRLPN
jgi:N-dimethylarginine dimethylaminohydrolase